jgi:hypothetical protein
MLTLYNGIEITAHALYVTPHTTKVRALGARVLNSSAD